MSNTIAEKLVILSDGLELIDQERQYQTDLILNLQDSLEQLSTPIPQSAPLITIDDSTGIITASVTQEQGGYVAPGTLQTQAEVKYHSQNLLPKNIKSGVKILGVTGTMSGGIDTSDATAAAEHMCEGVTAYVNGQKITGTAEDDLLDFDLGSLDDSGDTGQIDFYPALDPNKTYWFSGKVVPCIKVPLDAFGDVAAANVRKGKTFTSSSGYDVTGTMPDVTHAQPSISINAASGEVTASHTTAAGYTAAGTTSNTLQLSVQGATTITPSTTEQTAVAAGFYTKGAVKVAGDADLKAANIRNGVSIFNVTGTYTSDATAAATHILKDKIAYSKGSKITGTMTNNGAWSCTGINAGAEYTIPTGYHSGSGKIIANSLSAQTEATATAADIIKGKTAWVDGSKITGSMEYLAKAEQLPTTYGRATASKLTGLGATGIEELPAVAISAALTNAITTKKYVDASTSIVTKAAVSQFGTASAANVLAGQTFTSSAGFNATGTMTNQGAKTATLNAGGSYTIPAGYHNGSGKVTANSLASQTSGSAAANEILSGETAWVNGTKITGSLKKMTASIDEASDILYITIT